MSGHILYHNCMLAIQSRFYFFMEDLVVGCNDVTELSCAGSVAFRVASARSSRDLRTLADVTIRILRKDCK